MKIFTKVAAVICLFFQFSIMSLGQVADSIQTGIFKKGNWELNFSASIGNLTTSRSSSSSGAYSSASDSKSSSVFYIQLGAIPAYFFTDDLSFEPEINVFIQSQEGADNKPSLSFLGNLAYNFNLPQKNFAPFVRIGYGISNSLQIPVVIGILGRVSDDLNVSILNAGAGLKVVISKHVLLRTEIDLRRYAYTYKSNSLYYDYSYDYKVTSISGIFGFSIVL